jgi:hypothetical protein
MAIWAATIPLMPYALWRKKYDFLAGLVLLFFMLLIDVFVGLNRPNPDWVVLIRVASGE